ncbi:hypothetical protein [Brevundimonas sp.]|uniref:hypothetical protein n=1 Tax=Brevundimonas sp. TaxID=1871086 RepID=UPI0028985B1B|nr:hypothetical protein [Brevundimonas sp.]
MSGKTLKEARSEWDAATRAWSRDDCADVMKTMKAGERMLYAAIDLICLLEDAADSQRAAA